MIAAQILSIDQSYALDGSGVTKNFAVIRLPGGSDVRAEIGEEDTKLLIEASLSSSLNTTQEETSDDSFNGVADVAGLSNLEMDVQPPPMNVPKKVGREMVAWKELPEDTVTPLIRSFLTELNIPDVIPRADLDEIITNIIEGYNAGQQAPAEEPSSAQPRVRIERGAKLMKGGAPMRTIQKDEKGYPIVQQRAQDHDPGEVVDDADEDGIGSI